MGLPHVPNNLLLGEMIPHYLLDRMLGGPRLVPNSAEKRSWCCFKTASIRPVLEIHSESLQFTSINRCLNSVPLWSIPQFGYYTDRLIPTQSEITFFFSLRSTRNHQKKKKERERNAVTLLCLLSLSLGSFVYFAVSFTSSSSTLHMNIIILFHPLFHILHVAVHRKNRCKHFAYIIQ
jgi:hypothetical protein